MTDSLEQVPDAWAREFMQLLEHFEQPDAVAEWRPGLEDMPWMFAVVTKKNDGVSVEANVVRVYDEFPPGMWALGGVDYMLEKLTVAVGKQRGAGDERMVPVVVPGYRIVALGMVGLRIDPEGKTDPWPTLYCTDIDENFYLRRRMCDPTAITEWGKLTRLRGGEEFGEFWHRQFHEHPGLSATHVHLGRLLWTILMSPEACERTYGEPVVTEENAEQVTASVWPFLEAMGAVDPDDPRNPERRN